MSDHRNEHATNGLRLGDGGHALEERLRRESRAAWTDAPDGLHDAIMARINEDQADATDTFAIETIRPQRRHWFAALAMTGTAIAAAVLGMISLSGGLGTEDSVTGTDNGAVAQVESIDDQAPNSRLGTLLAGLSDRVREFDATPPEEMLLDEGRAILSDVRSLVTNVGQRGRTMWPVDTSDRAE